MLNSRLVFTREQGGQGREGRKFLEQKKTSGWWPNDSGGGKSYCLFCCSSLSCKCLFICDNVAGNVLGSDKTRVNISALRDG